MSNLLLVLRTFDDFIAWKTEVWKKPNFDGIYGPDSIGILEAIDTDGKLIGTYDTEFCTGTIWE